MYFDPNDKQSLTAKVYARIRDDIIEGRYSNGDYLVETKLAEELDVSRTPIREALKQLELEDLVVSIPNRGVMVQGMTSHDIDDIFTIRHLIEGQAAYWAAERIDQKSLVRLTEIIELMEMYTRKNDATNLARLDTEFHDVIFSACDSRVLRHILAQLHQNTRQVRRNSLTTPERPTRSLSEHRRVFEAIEQHKPEEAKAAMEAHVANAHNRRADA
ncbi:MAG TPA: GntR family transcriptional regulator [Clostridia bacterium]|jgi:DNA-binding GntR family transcriptional regulator|nr:MAG: Pyruvate dehydrogenase complex repressor [Firmicutes bacterium ADurb.Bin248]HOG01760.1 GntR family transcriptional regulator [Clostridia bacterium]HOS18694.1 GntR family transcriptional regulator [Clostridia bacterium]HPK14584.1 GntR family transcriptional regulator [Clostridia bacterium]